MQVPNYVYYMHNKQNVTFKFIWEYKKFQETEQKHVENIKHKTTI